jgi:hypothetical protein
VEAIRALMVAKRTARAQRTQTINQARALIITSPDGNNFSTKRWSEVLSRRGHASLCDVRHSYVPLDALLSAGAVDRAVGRPQ